MNRRTLLNVVIFGILTFYILFSIVYRDMMDVHVADLTDEDPWAQPFLIPKGWSLQRLEFGKDAITLSADNEWLHNGELDDRASKIAKNWSELVVQDVTTFAEATTGETVLAFVADTTQPIVYRILMQDGQILLYRLNDRRRFAFPADIRDVIWLDDA